MASTLRLANAGDLTELARMGAALARQHHEYDPRRFIFPDGMQDGYAWWFGRELKNPDAIIQVALQKERVVGYAYATLEERDWNALLDACGHLHDLWVDPAARGSGAGRMLARAILTECGERGAPRVVLSSASQNLPAQRLFSSLGWRPTMVEMTREL